MHSWASEREFRHAVGFEGEEKNWHASAQKTNPTLCQQKPGSVGPSVASKGEPIIIIGNTTNDRKSEEAYKYDEEGKHDPLYPHLPASSAAAPSAAARNSQLLTVNIDSHKGEGEVPGNSGGGDTQQGGDKDQDAKGADKHRTLEIREMTRTKPGVVSRVQTAHSFAHPELVEADQPPQKAASAGARHQPQVVVDAKSVMNPRAKGSYAGSSVAVDSEVTTHVSAVAYLEAGVNGGQNEGNDGKAEEKEVEAAVPGDKKEGSPDHDEDDFHMDSGIFDQI